MERVIRSRVRKRRGRASFAQVFFPALLLALTLFALLRGGNWLLTSPYFEIREVRWEGLKRLRPDLLSGRLEPLTGRNIFRVSLIRAVERLEEEPWIKQVAVHRELPHRVVISVQERKPFAVLTRPGGDYLVDEEGVVLKPVQIPSDSDRSLTRLEEEGNNDIEAIQQGLMLAEFLSGSDPSWPRVVKVERTGDIATQWEGKRVLWGWGDYPDKWDRLRRVEEDMKRRGEKSREVDLRFDHQVVVR